MCELGFEGVVAKNHSSLYRPNDHGWVKVKNPNHWRRDPSLRRAHYVIDHVRRCIRCDGPRVVPPLTLEERFRGEGGEDRRQAFENDWDAVLNKTATREQLERFRWAIGATNEAVNAVAGVV